MHNFAPEIKNNCYLILNFTTMKKLVLFVATMVAVAFASCTCNNTESEAAEAVETEEVAAPAEEATIADTIVAAADSVAAVVE